MMIMVECGGQLITIMIEQEGTTEATYAPYMWLPPLGEVFTVLRSLPYHSLPYRSLPHPLP